MKKSIFNETNYFLGSKATFKFINTFDINLLKNENGEMKNQEEMVEVVREVMNLDKDANLKFNYLSLASGNKNIISSAYFTLDGNKLIRISNHGSDFINYKNNLIGYGCRTIRSCVGDLKMKDGEKKRPEAEGIFGESVFSIAITEFKNMTIAEGADANRDYDGKTTGKHK